MSQDNVTTKAVDAEPPAAEAPAAATDTPPAATEAPPAATEAPPAATEAPKPAKDIPKAAPEEVALEPPTATESTPAAQSEIAVSQPAEPKKKILKHATVDESKPEIMEDKKVDETKSKKKRKDKSKEDKEGRSEEKLADEKGSDDKLSDEKSSDETSSSEYEHRSELHLHFMDHGHDKDNYSAMYRASRLDSTVDLMRPFEDDEDSDSSTASLHSTGSYVFQKKLSVKPDFFDVLGEIPSLAEISLDLTIDDDELGATTQQDLQMIDPNIDEGHFVDPLTGEAITSSSEEEAPPPVIEEIEHDADEEDQEDDVEFEDDDLLIPDIDEDLAVAKVGEDDALDMWMHIDEPTVIKITEVIDFEEYERQEAARILRVNTKDFLEQLIKRIVEKCEYVDPNTILRQNLDKMNLINKLQLMLAQLDIEQKARFFLHRKTVEFFRRKKAFRAIMDDNTENYDKTLLKYKEATQKLDQLLGREEETKNVTNLKLETLESAVFDAREQSRQTVKSLEDLVRKTLHKETYERLGFIVDMQLTKMAQYRDEISEVRYVIIQRQHTLATLMEKLEKLENLGNGLRMRDFEHLQTQTQALGKKIEERNSELNKLRTRCNADLHIMAHMKEKRQMLRNINAVQEIALNELIDEKYRCRENQYELKVDRGKIRKEIKELSFQGGLIDKPALMLDYDETVDRLEKLHIKVDQMKIKYSDIQQKVHLLEEKCERYSQYGL